MKKFMVIMLLCSCVSMKAMENLLVVVSICAGWHLHQSYLKAKDMYEVDRDTCQPGLSCSESCELSKSELAELEGKRNIMEAKAKRERQERIELVLRLKSTEARTTQQTTAVCLAQAPQPPSVEMVVGLPGQIQAEATYVQSQLAKAPPPPVPDQRPTELEMVVEASKK